LAEFGHISEKRGPYHIPRREHYKREIHRLSTSALTNRGIAEKLNIPERSLRRWQAEIYGQDAEKFLKPTAQEIALRGAILREKLMKRQEGIMRDIIENEEVDAETKLEAYRTLAELDYIDYQSYFRVAADIVRHAPPEVAKLIQQ
jgi:hypothetical protein